MATATAAPTAQAEQKDARKFFSYQDLVVWQRAMTLVTAVYELTAQFPEEELYGLTAHMRHAAIVMPSTIAEGKRSPSKKEFIDGLRSATRAGAELETHVEIAKQLPGTQGFDYQHVETVLGEVMRMLSALTKKLNAPKAEAK